MLYFLQFHCDPPSLLFSVRACEIKIWTNKIMKHRDEEWNFIFTKVLSIDNLTLAAIH